LLKFSIAVKGQLVNGNQSKSPWELLVATDQQYNNWWCGVMEVWW